MNDCIFCKIINQEVPADIVYEDEHFLAFLDINPVRKGHTLVIPKAHFRWIEDAPDETVAQGFLLATKIIRVLKNELHCDFTQLVVEGNEVPHFHISVIPGFANTPNATFHHEAYDDIERQAYQVKIKNAL